MVSAEAARGHHCSALLHVSNLIPELRGTVETEITKKNRVNDWMGMEWMDKGDIWLPQKIDPMPEKIPGANTGAFYHSGPINTWPQIGRCGHYESSNTMVWAPWQEGLRILSHNEEIICNLLDNYWKRKQIVKYLELMVTGNLSGDWSLPMLLPVSKNTKYSMPPDWQSKG